MATTPLGWAPVSPDAEQDSLPGEPLTRTVAIVTDAGAIEQYPLSADGKSPVRVVLLLWTLFP